MPEGRQAHLGQPQVVQCASCTGGFIVRIRTKKDFVKMGMYHLHIDSIGGSSSGRASSAVGFSAYISGEKAVDERTGIIYDFSRKEVEDKEIMLPQNAPDRLLDRSVLWNEVEKMESKKSNSCFAQRLDAALPRELSVDTCKEVMREFGTFFTDHGFIADLALHYNSHNPHIHAILTARKLDDTGDWEKYKEKKVYSLDEEGNRIPVIDKETGLQKVDSRNRLQWKREKIVSNGWNRQLFLDIRKEWEAVCNDALERNGIEDRIDCRSYADQGIDKIPTVHEGRAAREMEAKGQIADVCEENRKIRKINMLHDLIEKVSGGIEVLHHKIESVTMEVQQEFFDAFKSITARAAELIEANKEEKVDSENLKNTDQVDSSGIYKNDEDPVDRDEDWWDPV